MNRLGPWMCAVWLAAGCSGNDDDRVYSGNLPGDYLVTEKYCDGQTVHDTIRVHIEPAMHSTLEIYVSFRGGEWFPRDEVWANGTGHSDDRFTFIKSSLWPTGVKKKMFGVGGVVGDSLAIDLQLEYAPDNFTFCTMRGRRQ